MSGLDREAQATIEATQRASEESKKFYGLGCLPIVAGGISALLAGFQLTFDRYLLGPIQDFSPRTVAIAEGAVGGALFIYGVLYIFNQMFYHD